MNQLLLSPDTATMFDGSPPVEYFIERIEGSLFVPEPLEDLQRDPQDLSEAETASVELVVTAKALHDACSKKKEEDIEKIPGIDDKRLQVSFVLSRLGIVSKESVRQFYYKTRGYAITTEPISSTPQLAL